MPLTVHEIERLCASARSTGVEIRITASGDMIIRPINTERRPLTATERTRIRRERMRNETEIVSHETGNGTIETNETNETEIVSQQTQPPSPPPSSPSPLHPPSPPAPAPAPVHEPAPMREEPKKERKSGSKASRISEAKATTEGCTLPKDLQTEPFTEVWADWCQHRERLAAAGKPWTALAARTLLRQCADNGEAWSIKAIRNSLANGYQGVFWEQKDNPEDVRSQPMKPVNRMQAELPIPRDPSKPIVYTGGRVKSPWD